MSTRTTANGHIYVTVEAEAEIDPADLDAAGWHHESDCGCQMACCIDGEDPEPPYNVLAVIGSLHRQAHPSQHTDPLMCREEPCRSLPMDALRGVMPPYPPDAGAWPWPDPPGARTRPRTGPAVPRFRAGPPTHIRSNERTEMSYTINAAGHTASEDTERKLHAELAGVLAKPEYGCTWSTFSGTHVSGTIHLHASQDTEHVHETEPKA